MSTSLRPDFLENVSLDLERSNREFAENYPGERADRQPVHTVYGGAHLFKSDTARKLGESSQAAFKAYAPDAISLAQALKLPGKQAFWKTVYNRVEAKLKREAVEDFRIDFEDGFGNRPDQEEDETAIRAAEQVAKGMKEGTLPPFIGIRIKPFTEELKNRSFRTLDLFITTLLSQTDGKLPENFVITLPKVTMPEQVAAFVRILEALEDENSLEWGTLKIELMVETTQSIFNKQGHSALPLMVEASKGRCLGAHFGTYDYTASCDITAAHQVMDHGACDFARSVMKVTLGNTGIWLSDGATNVMPVGPHRGNTLTDKQVQENKDTVHRAWKLAYDHIRHSLKNGYYQGWDLHPAQFPIRYAACYSFFLEGFEEASIRLKNFMDKAAQATLVGDIFDDAATGQGLLNYFLRALNCGAITLDEVLETGLTLEEIRARSFASIMKKRLAQ